MSLADLSGIAVLMGRLVIPFSGIWHSDLVLVDTAQPSTGPQILTLSASTWACAVVRQIDFAGRRGLRLIGGRGGWRTAIPPKQYGQGVVPTQAVCADAAAACGELPPVIDPSAPQTVGPAYVRKGLGSSSGGLASAVLQEVLGDSWWMDSAGVIQTMPRPSTPILSDFQALDVDGTSGMYELATDVPGDWLPGRTFTGPTVSGTISRVEHILTPDSLRTWVMVS